MNAGVLDLEGKGIEQRMRLDLTKSKNLRKTV